MLERVGGSFTVLTVSTKMFVAQPKLVSITDSVTAAVPDLCGAGVSVIERVPVLPASTMFAFGSRLVLEELAVTVSRLVGVPESLIVKFSGPATVSSLIVWLPGPVRVGTELADGRK